MPRKLITAESPCPCGAGKTFAQCCGPLIAGVELPATAEQLMRSRYSAYATFNLEYVKETWHPDTLPPRLKLVRGQTWVGLKIQRVEAGEEDETTGIVEFEARSKRFGITRKMREVSFFEKKDGRWLYVSGDYSVN